MKVKLNQSVYLQGEHHNEGDILFVDDRLAGAWIQTGKAHEISGKKTLRSSDREPISGSGGENTSTESHSESDD